MDIHKFIYIYNILMENLHWHVPWGQILPKTTMLSDDGICKLLGTEYKKKLLESIQKSQNIYNNKNIFFQKNKLV